MSTNILSIQPRRQDFRTQANADWLDGLLVWQSGQGGVVAGAGNKGNGALTVASVAAGTALGAHIVSITSLDGVVRFTVQNPNGAVTALGVVGLACFADGITFTLASGSTAFAVDDTFAIGVLPSPIDLTGIQFDLTARSSTDSAIVRLSATSHPTDPTVLPTILAGTTGGQIGMRLYRDAMAVSRFPRSLYVYDILASADGFVVPVFYGTIDHVTGVGLLS